jgi:hypothetical protein
MITCFECNKGDLRFAGHDDQTGEAYYKCNECQFLFTADDITAILRKSYDKGESHAR